MSLGGKSYLPKEGLQNSSTLPKKQKIDVCAKLANTAVPAAATAAKIPTPSLNPAICAESVKLFL